MKPTNFNGLITKVSEYWNNLELHYCASLLNSN